MFQLLISQADGQHGVEVLREGEVSKAVVAEHVGERNNDISLLEGISNKGFVLLAVQNPAYAGQDEFLRKWVREPALDL